LFMYSGSQGDREWKALSALSSIDHHCDEVVLCIGHQATINRTGHKP